MSFLLRADPWLDEKDPGEGTESGFGFCGTGVELPEGDSDAACELFALIA